MSNFSMESSLGTSAELFPSENPGGKDLYNFYARYQATELNPPPPPREVLLGEIQY